MKKLSDEQAFADYLRGGSPLSRAYAELGDDEPPADLDETVTGLARHALQERAQTPRRWLVPLSAAAVVMLSFGLVLRVTTAPVGPLPRDLVLETPQPAPEAARHRLPADARNEKARASEPAGSAKVAVDRHPATATCDELARIASASLGISAPAQRLEWIRCLRDAGDAAAARRELASWRADYPRQPIPADLSDLEQRNPE